MGRLLLNSYQGCRNPTNHQKQPQQNQAKKQPVVIDFKLIFKGEILKLSTLLNYRLFLSKTINRINMAKLF